MKVRLAAIALTAALAAAACSESNPSSETSEPPTTASTTAPQEDAEPNPTVATVEPTTAKPTTAEPIEQLRILHPETLAFSAPFATLVTDGALADVATEVAIDIWTSPDVLRSVLVNGDTDVAAVPSNVGANLYNRGIDVRMAAVLVWGLIWVIGPDGTAADWESIRGQTVMIPFPNDMPDLVFQYLAEANGMTPGVDFEIEYYAQPPEIVGRLLTGNGEWAVLPEHVVTIVLAQEGANSLGRVFDLQSEWADATGSATQIPQAGIVVRGELADERPDVIAALLNELERAVEVVNAASPDTVAMLSEASGVPAPLVEQVIPRLNLELVAADAAQSDLERFFTELATLNPGLIGGGLPDDGFYLRDPR